MLTMLARHPRIILTEKVDRLYRNVADWVRIEDLSLTVHLVKEHRTIGPESRSQDQFLHGIQVLMARNYFMNLSEETRKGQPEKAQAGMYPSCAPTGYRNIQGPDGKRIIIPHPEEAAVIRELYRRFATGQYSIKDLAASTRKEGLLLAGKPFHKTPCICSCDDESTVANSTTRGSRTTAVICPHIEFECRLEAADKVAAACRSTALSSRRRMSLSAAVITRIRAERTTDKLGQDSIAVSHSQNHPLHNQARREPRVHERAVSITTPTSFHEPMLRPESIGSV